MRRAGGWTTGSAGWLGCARRAFALVGAMCLIVLFDAAALRAEAQPERRDAPGSRDVRLEHALVLLPVPPAVPVDIVDPDRLSKRLLREVRRACGFIIRGVPRIYISSRCPAYQQADRNPFSAIALAAVIGHEMAHLEGADEPRAREVEADLVQTLARRLPGEYRVRVAEYVAGLRQRRSPVDCETHTGGIAFHACRSDVAEVGGTADALLTPMTGRPPADTR